MPKHREQRHPIETFRLMENNGKEKELYKFFEKLLVNSTVNTQQP